MPGVAARQRVPVPGRVQGPAQPLRGTHWAVGTGTEWLEGGEGSCCEPQIPEERQGGRASRGSRLEDEQLSESSQSTLTR